MPSNINVTREQFISMHEPTLAQFTQNLDSLKDASIKNAYALELVQTASQTDLRQLETLRLKLAPVPKKYSFWFRLDQAVNIKRLVLEFEAGNFSQLASFWNISEPTLHCFRALVFELTEQTSQRIAQQAHQTLSPLKILGFQQKLQTISSYVAVGTESSPIMIAFGELAMRIRERLESSDPPPLQSLGQSRDTIFATEQAVQGDSSQAQKEEAMSHSP